jgi:DNA-binding transcriptional LysR family regulator
MATSLDDLVSLAVFARVAEARSMTAAAARLGLSKSVVSRRIRDLEDGLGVRLLLRTTRRVALTDAGFRLFEHCARLLADADAAASAACEVATAPRGPLRVSAPVDLAVLHLMAATAEFIRGHPEIEVDLTASDRLVDLLEEGVDLAIRVTRLRGHSGLIARKLCSDRTLVCASPRYLEAHGTPREPADLVHHRCLRYSQLAARDEWVFHGTSGWYPVPVKAAFTANNGGVLREAALAGLGIGVLPSFLVAAELAAGRLVTLFEEERPVDIGVYAVHAHGRQVPARVRAYIDFLANWFRRAPWRRDTRRPG